MAARRYRGPRAGASLKTLLAFTLLSKRSGPAGLPGQPDMSNQNLKCPEDGSLLVRNQDGTYHCQKNGHFYKTPPQAK
jgi:hypothetical protein